MEKNSIIIEHNGKSTCKKYLNFTLFLDLSNFADFKSILVQIKYHEIKNLKMQNNKHFTDINDSVAIEADDPTENSRTCISSCS